jgi:hypothetical protein
MSNTGGRTKPEAIREIGFAGLTNAFATLGAPLVAPSRAARMVNETNAAVYVSIDGVTKHYRISPGSAYTKDEKSNDSFYEAGTQFYVMYATAPTGPVNSEFFIETEFV